jgi:hypothetical protein
MPTALTDQQRAFAQHFVTFDQPLSYDLSEALRRATLACAENATPQTGVIEFFCGLGLHYEESLTPHFNGDFALLLSRVFPKHRFGVAGLIPEQVIKNATEDDPSCGTGMGYSIRLSDELIRLLWTATRLANAVGKKTSLKDVIAAVSLDDEWVEELRKHGIAFRQQLADFRQVLDLVFFKTQHANTTWPRKFEFEVDSFNHPFAASVKTPSGGFQPMRKATVKLNGNNIAAVSWPDQPEVTVEVALKSRNAIEFEIDGPQFGSMEIAIRRTPQAT